MEVVVVVVCGGVCCGGGTNLQPLFLSHMDLAGLHTSPGVESTIQWPDLDRRWNTMRTIPKPMSNWNGNCSLFTVPVPLPPGVLTGSGRLARFRVRDQADPSNNVSTRHQ